MEAYPCLFCPFREDTELGDNDSCFSIDREGNITKSSDVCLVNTNVSGLGLYSITNNISSLRGIRFSSAFF